MASSLGFPNFPSNFNFNWISPRFSLQPNHCFIGISTGFVIQCSLTAKASASSPTQGQTKETTSNGLNLPNFTIIFLSNMPEWFKWIVRTILFFAMPYYKKILRVQDRAKTVLDVVESIAEVTEKIAEEVAENSPENSKAKQAAETVDKASEIIADGAQLVENIIDKVDDVLDDVENAVKPEDKKKKN